MVRHTTNTVEHTIVLTAKAKNVHIQVALMFLDNDRSIAVGTEDDMVNQFRIGHNVIVGAPFQGAFPFVDSVSAGRSDLRLLKGDAFSVPQHIRIVRSNRALQRLRNLYEIHYS